MLKKCPEIDVKNATGISFQTNNQKRNIHVQQYDGDLSQMGVNV